MKLSTLQSLSRSMVVLLATLLASCAMPPKEAWRFIRRDGLIPYLAVELGRRPLPPQYQEQPNRYLATTPTPGPCHCVIVPAPVPTTPRSDSKVAASSNVKPTPDLYLNNKIVQTDRPSSRSVEKDSAPEKVKPKNSEPTVAQSPKPVKPAESLTAHSVKPKMEPKVDAAKPDVAKSSSPSPQPAPDKSEAKPKTEAAPKVAETKGKTDELPYGTPVPARPGLVNSPYAGKMQLVDVTGLKPGQEVKCPYTGKLFRVPPGAQAKVEEKK